MSLQEDFTRAVLAMLIANPHVKLAFGNVPQIYAVKPENAKVPFVTFDVRETCVEGAYDMRVTVWTTHETRLDISRRLDALEAALRGGQIALSGFDITSRCIRLRDIFTDDSCKTRNGLLQARFHIKTMETIK